MMPSSRMLVSAYILLVACSCCFALMPVDGQTYGCPAGYPIDCANTYGADSNGCCTSGSTCGTTSTCGFGKCCVSVYTTSGLGGGTGIGGDTSSSSGSGSSNIGAIIGGVVGGVVVLALAAYLIRRFCFAAKPAGAAAAAPPASRVSGFTWVCRGCGFSNSGNRAVCTGQDCMVEQINNNIDAHVNQKKPARFRTMSSPTVTSPHQVELQLPAYPYSPTPAIKQQQLPTQAQPAIQLQSCYVPPQQFASPPVQHPSQQLNVSKPLSNLPAVVVHTPPNVEIKPPVQVSPPMSIAVPAPMPASAPSKSPFCSSCGLNLSAVGNGISKFCPQCGAPRA